MTRSRDPEERVVAGEASGLTPVYNRLFPHKAIGEIDLSDCLVARPKPFRLTIWEPLATKAPSPPKARPHCCYIQTVIFYHFPHVLALWPGTWRPREGGPLRMSTRGFQEWDQVKTRLAVDDVVAFAGEHFAVDGGRVLWRQGRWWSFHHARRWEARPR